MKKSIMHYEQFYGRTIFVDANAIIYHLQGVDGPSKEIFRLGELKRLKLLSTTRVIDEVIHKTLLINAKRRFGMESQLLKKLKKDREKVKQLAADLKVIWDFLNVVNMDVKEITFKDLKEIPGIIEQYGLFGNDCLVLLTMNKYNLKYLLSSDTDFEGIEWVRLIKAM